MAAALELRPVPVRSMHGETDSHASDVTVIWMRISALLRSHVNLSEPCVYHPYTIINWRPVGF